MHTHKTTNRLWEALKDTTLMALRCLHSSKIYASSYLISATLCTGDTSCGTLLDDKTTCKAMENLNMETGLQVFRLSIICFYGDQNLLPDELKANKGHNVFYCLPLILGLLGLFWQAWRGRRGIQQFWVVFFLFFMTGLAIVVYLNQTPGQPRERDYAYAGSFYAYAIWCGLGVLAIYDWLKKLKLSGTAAAAIASVASIIVPIQMASQNLGRS